MRAGKEVERGNLLVVERHLIAAPDAVGFPDFEPKTPRLFGDDAAQLFRRMGSEDRQAIFL